MQPVNENGKIVFGDTVKLTEQAHFVFSSGLDQMGYFAFNIGSSASVTDSGAAIFFRRRRR